MQTYSICFKSGFKLRCIVAIVAWLTFICLIAHNIGAQSIANPPLLPVAKPPIDTDVYDKWPSVSNGAIGGNGKFVAYSIFNQPVGGCTMVVLSVDGKWKRMFPGVEAGQFSPDNRTFVFISPRKELCLVHLSDTIVECISNVNSFRILGTSQNCSVAFTANDSGQSLTVMNLKNRVKKRIESVKDYTVSEDGAVLIIKTENRKLHDKEQTLTWLDLNRNTAFTFWQGWRADNIVLDNKRKQVAFIEYERNSASTNIIRYFKPCLEKASLLIDSRTTGFNVPLKISGLNGFSGDGKRLFLSLKKEDPKDEWPAGVKVDIWSYLDEKLQSQQLKDINRVPIYLAVTAIDAPRIIRLEYENENAALRYETSGTPGSCDFIIVSHREGDADISEINWNRSLKTSVFLVSTIDGSRRAIREIDRGIGGETNLSPGGKYIIYYDAAGSNYWSYEIKTGKLINITQGMAVAWTYYSDLPNARTSNIPIAGWLENDEGVFLYDHNDIWLFDPAGIRPPENFTNSTGKENDMVFRFAFKVYSSKVVGRKEKLLLSVFNKRTMENGFYNKRVGDKSGPVRLIMDSNVYSIDLGQSSFNSECEPLKARNAEAYLVQRMNAGESPNYFWTADFKSFIPLSNIHPERKYNWLTATLLSWRSGTGTEFKGILYKPENFDSTRRYPVIFHYYEKFTDELNRFHVPAATEGQLNIPSFVSNGYLVFTPDIHYEVGNVGGSALNTLLESARFLSDFSFVDSTKFGLQGHSFGGYETNYIVSHSDRFAAAVSGSGVSDCVSMYGSLLEGSGISLKGYIELSQGRLGTTLWENPALYVRNSPVFSADKVTTPVLMMNNRKDGAVPFIQGVEFFTALRRLGKRAWMLQYDDGGHGVYGREAIDYTIRIFQFFDHYLKDAPAPRWMTRGVPAAKKGIDTGLELDSAEKPPEKGLIIN